VATASTTAAAANMAFSLMGELLFGEGPIVVGTQRVRRPD
jgi:hypothetical protein